MSNVDNYLLYIILCSYTSHALCDCSHYYIGPHNPQCALILCREPDCSEEDRYTPDGSCCPVCRETPIDCSTVICVSPLCRPNQEIFTPEGKCCPQCRDIVPDCSTVLCPLPKCRQDQEIFTPEGECCPICRPLDCSMVRCASPNCGKNQVIFTPEGECCPSCRDAPRDLHS